MGGRVMPVSGDLQQVTHARRSGAFRLAGHRRSAPAAVPHEQRRVPPAALRRATLQHPPHAPLPPARPPRRAALPARIATPHWDCLLVGYAARSAAAGAVLRVGPAAGFVARPSAALPCRKLTTPQQQHTAAQPNAVPLAGPHRQIMTSASRPPTFARSGSSSLTTSSFYAQPAVGSFAATADSLASTPQGTPPPPQLSKMNLHNEPPAIYTVRATPTRAAVR